MGLLQQAVKTYDFMKSVNKVGMYVAEEREPLAPIGHIIAQAKIEITLDPEGNFIKAERVDKRIMIPVTEESSGRTSAPAPHPLCENLAYLIGDNDVKFDLYIKQLQRWADSEFGSVKLNAVLRYIKSKNILNDLLNCGIVELNDKGNIKNEKDIVCWNFIGADEDLLKSFEEFYCSEKANEKNDICYLTGNTDVVAKQHLKGVVSYNGNAKIISANDEQNFTYLGRFTNSEQVLTIGYVASQKAHNALKWLAANEGSSFGNRTFLCWNPNGKKVIKPNVPFLRNDEKVKYIWKDYKEALKKSLIGYKNELDETEDVVIASFDAATQGRLSVTYYNEVKSSDFLERLKYWDETCCWYDNRWGVEAPSLYNIISCAFGFQRGSDERAKIEADKKIIGQHMQRLIKCRVDKESIPKDVVNNIVNKASNLQMYNKTNKEKLLFTACAVIRKFKTDYQKEECEMSLEPEKKDRSYQYGRLLAVLEKIEKDTYNNEKERTTNALRMQAVFIKRPAYAAKIIIEQLKNAYYPKLSPSARIYYDKLIGQIMEIISEFGDAEYNKPLGETYLLGYYLQQNSLYAKKEDNELKESEEEI